MVNVLGSFQMRSLKRDPEDHSDSDFYFEIYFESQIFRNGLYHPRWYNLGGLTPRNMYVCTVNTTIYECMIKTDAYEYTCVRVCVCMCVMCMYVCARV